MLFLVLSFEVIFLEFSIAIKMEGGINMSEKKYEAQKKYDKDNTKFIGLKLNKTTDKDILDAIEGKPKQTELKKLIRKGLEQE